MNIFEAITNNLFMEDLVSEVEGFVNPTEDNWVELSQEERDALVLPKCEEFVNKYKDVISYDQVMELLDVLHNDNFHTEEKILRSLFIDERLAD